MSRVVVFGDLVADTIGMLATELPARFAVTAPVVHTIPTPRPDEFVRIMRTGGTTTTAISETVQITVEAWALTTERAHDLCQQVRALLHAWPHPGEILTPLAYVGAIYRTDELGGPVELPDAESEQRRFTFSVRVHVRGAAI